jgi:type IV pilus assembly protein PilC
VSTYVFKAMDVAGAPMRGQVDAESKQAVSDQLKSRAAGDPRHRREALLARDQPHLFERITLSELAIFSRQLATMVSSGMTILRALFVLEEQTESKKLKEVIVSCARTSRRACPSATRWPATRRSSARCSSR